ncbi:hypothetical protein D3C72_1676620 [compost metagenome]
MRARHRYGTRANSGPLLLSATAASAWLLTLACTLTALAARFRRFVPVIGSIALIALTAFCAALVAHFVLIVSHDLSPLTG